MQQWSLWAITTVEAPVLNLLTRATTDQQALQKPLACIPFTRAISVSPTRLPSPIHY